MESLSDLIDGMLVEPNSEPICPSSLKEDRWPDRWHEEFWKPFLPGTRVIFRQASGVIIDHTDPQLKPQPQYEFDFNKDGKYERVYVLSDDNFFKDGCYQPYWLCFIDEIRLEDENSNII